MLPTAGMSVFGGKLGVVVVGFRGGGQQVGLQHGRRPAVCPWKGWRAVEKGVTLGHVRPRGQKSRACTRRRRRAPPPPCASLLDLKVYLPVLLALPDPGDSTPDSCPRRGVLWTTGRSLRCAVPPHSFTSPAQAVPPLLLTTVFETPPPVHHPFLQVCKMRATAFLLLGLVLAR